MVQVARAAFCMESFCAGGTGRELLLHGGAIPPCIPLYDSIAVHRTASRSALGMWMCDLHSFPHMTQWIEQFW
jgi:hypothetical protein